MFYAGRKSVTTAITLLDPVVKDAESPGGLAIKNLGTASVFIGGANVTTNTDADGGWELAPGEQVSIDFTAYSDIYAIAATGTQKVQLMRTSAP